MTHRILSIIVIIIFIFLVLFFIASVANGEINVRVGLFLTLLGIGVGKYYSWAKKRLAEEKATKREINNEDPILTNETAIFYCTECGEKAESTMQFCAGCGSKLS